MEYFFEPLKNPPTFWGYLTFMLNPFTFFDAKGGIMSEDIVGFLPLPKNIPKIYLKLSYPLHGIDKVLVEFNRLHVKKYYSYEIKI